MLIGAGVSVAWACGMFGGRTSDMRPWLHASLGQAWVGWMGILIDENSLRVRR